MQKIYITGTGRSGTTFLMRLFTFLELDTGYNKTNYKDFIFKNCNSGIEKAYKAKPYIIKSPYLVENLRTLVMDESIRIKAIIVSIHNYTESATSRQ